MRTSFPGAGRRTRLTLLGLVAALHLAVLLAWRGGEGPKRAPAPARQTIQVVLLPAPEAVARPAETRPVPGRTRAAEPPAAAPTRPRYRAVAPAMPTAVSGAPLDASATGVGAASPAASAVSAAPPTASPLNLELPRGPGRRAAGAPTLVERALNDPRANTPRLSFEKRMAADFDTAVTVEVLADGTKRYRRGAECVLAHPSRAGQLDPFDRVHNQLEGIEKCP